MNGISKTPLGIVLENSFFLYTIDYDGKVVSFTDKKDGTNYIDNIESPYFCYLNIDATGKTVANPINMEFKDGELIFGFIAGSYLTIKPEIKDNYITFEVTKVVGLSSYSIAFANTRVKYDIIEGKDFFAMSNLAMKLNTKAISWPSFKEMTAGGLVFGEIGFIGGKIAIFGAPVSKHIDILKTIASDIPKGDAPVAYGVGGPWAKENKDERGDYIIVSPQKPEQLASDLKMYTELNVDQLDFHKGNPFRQGDFYFFTDETGEAKAFKEKMVSQLTPHGIKAGLHTYSFYIDPYASGILTNPKWQKQLLPAEKYTLAEDLDIDALEFITEENTEFSSRLTGYRALASEFVLIDEEIIKISPLDIAPHKFPNIIRGIADTKPAKHSKGAKVIRIASYYSGLCPVINSELYYEIARQTARAYNEGGFGMIYFDALDGVGRHLTDKSLSWYYAAAFVNEVLKYTHDVPIVEMSFFAPPFYLSRGRAGAWDHPRRGYKNWNIAHTESNAQMQDNYLCAIFGWYNLYPLAPAGFPPSTHIKYHFLDDVDHMASLAVAYDFGMVYQNVTKTTIALPAVKKNTDRYAFYNKLRKENYFPETIKRQVREGKFEYSIIENNGKYSFVEKSYSPAKIINVDDNLFATTAHNNPFASQKPFIRLEAFPTTNGNDPIIALKLDENAELKSQVLSVDYPVLNPLNAANHHGLHFKVLGNNSDDALLIRIHGVVVGDINACDYYIPLNFEGWKDFYIVDIDNVEYDFNKFPTIAHNHYLDNRGNTEFAKIQKVEVALGGECDGVKMSSIELCEWQINDIVNPTVKVGNGELTFKCILQGGEYIEYTGEKCCIYDGEGNETPIEVIGSINAPSGKFNAVTARENKGGDHAKMKLTFGFDGQIIK